MKNTFGSSVCVTLFGESHGARIGAVLDGIAPGIPVDEDLIRHQLMLRRPSGRTAEGQLGGNESFIHRKPGSEAVDDRADFRAVAFTEQGDGNGSAEGVFHTNLCHVIHNSQFIIHNS